MGQSCQLYNILLKHPSILQFKDDCNTEKKIAAKLKSLVEKSLLLESEDKLRRDLFDLLQVRY